MRIVWLINLFFFILFILLPFSTQAVQVTIHADISSNGASSQGGRKMVWTSDTTGYVFFRDLSTTGFGPCKYSKTTNSGVSWATAVTVDSNDTCGLITVWFDKWTPGDTGTIIHISTFNEDTDDLFYNNLNTSNDTRLMGTTPVNVTGANQGGTFVAGETMQSITKGTDGTVYMAVSDSLDSFIIECTSSCNLATNWTETGTNPLDADYDPLVLVPYTSGDILLISNDVSANVIRSKRWNNSTWSGWTNIATSIEDSINYDGIFDATVDTLTSAIYLVFADDVAIAGTGDVDVRTGIYTGSWSLKTNVFTNHAFDDIHAVSIAFDENTADVYVAYAMEASSAATANVYWEKSTNGMVSWSSESAAVNSAQDDIVGVYLNMMNTDRIYVAWTEKNSTSDDTLLGDTIANLTPPTYTQSAYRFFNNADSTDVGSALAVQDTVVTLSAAGNAFRVRPLLHVDGDGARANLDTFKLQFVGKGSGSCASPFGGTPSSYTDVTASTVIAYKNNTTPADAAALTANANDPTHGVHTTVNQTYEELNNFTNSQAKITGGQDGMWDFALYDNNAPVGTVYCLRVVESSGTTLTTYSVYPQVTMAGGASLTLSFSISDNSIGFGTLSSSDDFFANGVGTGSATEVEAHTLTASTNATNGYLITIDGTTLRSSPTMITIMAIGSNNTSSLAGTEQFGLRATASGGNGSVSAPYAAAGFALDTAAFPDEIASDADGDDVSTTYSIRYLANIANITEAGSYTATLTYVVSATF